MRKIFICVLVISMLLITGCGESVPEDMNQQTYNSAKQALTIIEKYNSGDLDADEAEKRIDTIYDNLSSLDLEGDEQLNNLTVLNILDSFRMGINGYDYDTYSLESELKGMI